MAEPDRADYSGALFCAERALAAQSSDSEWAKAKYVKGRAQYLLNDYQASLAAFAEILGRFSQTDNPELSVWKARSLFIRASPSADSGATRKQSPPMTTPLRSSARLQNSLREQVAKALVNKGFALGQLGHIDEAIAVYDDLLTRFKDAPEPSLGELVQKATSLKKPLQPQ